MQEEKTESKSKPESKPNFNVGDTVVVHYTVLEGDKTRIQPYLGIVISKKGKGESKTFTVRRIADGAIGVERIFLENSPKIAKIVVKSRTKVRRAKITYMRKRIGKSASKV
ncbi:50S ribosomal protein L19 [Candidatus Parcubacteria bacterium]|nr:50S ribosomal protein L19 [Patescibacteria group bacterium]MBU4380873.1 50S ribosomal protein L19 [Patescibacteria group bacterium]MCG2688924.1 50S ribosomal protein L19 [Candidatus Parcubacteria bacterium]